MKQITFSNDCRIIFVPQMENYGGIERNIIALASYLQSQGIPCIVLCFYSDIDLSRYAGWDINVVQMTRSVNQYLKAWLLRCQLRKSRYMPLLFGIKAAFNNGIFYSRPFVLHFTDPPSLLSGNIKNKMSVSWLGKLRAAMAHHYTARGTKRAHTMVTMTERNRVELLSVYGVDSVVLSLGGQPPRRPTDYKKIGDCITLLSVCRLESSKRIDWIIRSVFTLRASKLDVRLWVVGKGTQRTALQTLVAELGLSDYVQFFGEVSDDELEDCFAQSSIFVMPAVQGYGLPALEALYRKIPVVLHSESGVSELLSYTEWASVFSGDASMLTTALAAFIDKLKLSDPDQAFIEKLPTEPDWAKKLSDICNWI